MASITTAPTATPANIATSGGTSTIAAAISDPDKVATITVSVDGTSGTTTVNLHENLTYSTNPADVGKPGCVVAVVDHGGSLAIGADGASFVFTAA